MCWQLGGTGFSGDSWVAGRLEGQGALRGKHPSACCFSLLEGSRTRGKRGPNLGSLAGELAIPQALVHPGLHVVYKIRSPPWVPPKALLGVFIQYLTGRVALETKDGCLTLETWAGVHERAVGLLVCVSSSKRY